MMIHFWFATYAKLLYGVFLFIYLFFSSSTVPVLVHHIYHTNDKDILQKVIFCVPQKEKVKKRKKRKGHTCLTAVSFWVNYFFKEVPSGHLL